MNGSRVGKYCPRCRTMTFLNQKVCEHCGHHFRSGASAPPPEASVPEAASLHRTQMFTLPPVMRQPSLPEAAPDTARGIPVPTPPGTRSAARRRAPFGLGLLAACLMLGWALAARHSAPVFVGEWEKVFGSGSHEAVTVALAFQPGGTGVFSWQEAGGGPAPGTLSGQAAMHWQQDDAGQVALSIEHPPATAPVPGTLIDIFNSHHWPCSVNGDRSRLQLGSVSFVRRSRRS